VLWYTGAKKITINQSNQVGLTGILDQKQLPQFTNSLTERLLFSSYTLNNILHHLFTAFNLNYIGVWKRLRH